MQSGYAVQARCAAESARKILRSESATKMCRAAMPWGASPTPANLQCRSMQKKDGRTHRSRQRRSPQKISPSELWANHPSKSPATA